MKKLFTLFLFVFAAVSMQVQAQRVVNVASETELRDAVTNAAAGDIIQITAAKITLSSTITVSNANAFTIRGNGPENTIIDGGWNGLEDAASVGGVRLFDVAAIASLTIEGVTLQRGRYDNSAGITWQYGGAIRNQGSLILTDCVLKENRIIGNNTESWGGALYNHSNATAILTNCQLTGNRADYIGGAITNMGALTVINCALTGNQAGGNGGAINIQGGGTTALLMINTTITGNHSDNHGGGLLVSGGETATVLNSIIVGNTADGDGDDIGNSNTANLRIAYSAYGDFSGPALADNTTNFPSLTAADVFANPGNSLALSADSEALWEGTLTGLKDGDNTMGYFMHAGEWSNFNASHAIEAAAGANDINMIVTGINTDPVTGLPARNVADGPICMGAWITHDNSDPGVHHLLSFTVDEGIRINPNHVTYHIAEGHDYTFYMYMEEGFAHKKPYVTVNGEPVKIRETQDGTGWVYRIPAVYANQHIAIVLQDLVSNLNPEAAGIYIYSSVGALIIEAAQPTAVTIYNTAGQAVAQQTVESRASIALPKGAYIVRTDEGTTKAVVR